LSHFKPIPFVPQANNAFARCKLSVINSYTAVLSVQNASEFRFTAHENLFEAFISKSTQKSERCFSLII